jgi:hypothetical protein
MQSRTVDSEQTLAENLECQYDKTQVQTIIDYVRDNPWQRFDKIVTATGVNPQSIDNLRTRNVLMVRGVKKKYEYAINPESKHRFLSQGIVKTARPADNQPNVEKTAINDWKTITINGTTIKFKGEILIN